jgi:hypothetical protein
MLEEIAVEMIELRTVSNMTRPLSKWLAVSTLVALFTVYAHKCLSLRTRGAHNGAILQRKA